MKYTNSKLQLVNEQLQEDLEVYEDIWDIRIKLYTMLRDSCLDVTDRFVKGYITIEQYRSELEIVMDRHRTLLADLKR